MADFELLGYATTHGVSGDLLDKVAHKADSIDDFEVLVAVAMNDGCHDTTRQGLALHRDGAVRAAAVRSNRLDIDIVRTLRHDPSDQVRFEVARHLGIGADVMDELMNDTPQVVLGLCENADMSVESIKVLMNHSDGKVREAASEAAEDRGVHVAHVDDQILGGLTPPPTPMDPAEQAAKVQGERAERAEVAMAPGLCEPVRSQIAADTDPLVRAVFARRDDLTTAEMDVCIADADAAVRSGVAGNANLDASKRDAMAYDPDVRVRVQVARLTADESLQAIMARDPQAIVRRSLVSRVTRLGYDAMMVLSADEDIRIRKTVALNRDELERLDAMSAKDLEAWKVSDYQTRLAQLVQGEAYVQALEMAPEFPGTLAALAAMCRALVVA